MNAFHASCQVVYSGRESKQFLVKSCWGQLWNYWNCSHGRVGAPALQLPSARQLRSKCQECRDHSFLCQDSECYRSTLAKFDGPASTANCQPACLRCSEHHMEKGSKCTFKAIFWGWSASECLPKRRGWSFLFCTTLFAGLEWSSPKQGVDLARSHRYKRGMIWTADLCRTAVTSSRSP